MKPFDLELAKKGYPVQTTDGRPARIICFDRKGKNKPIVALIYNKEDDEEYHHFYYNDGTFLTSKNKSDEDLVMVSTRKEGWVNIYSSSIYVAGISNVYETKEEALKGSDERGYITTTKIEWEE